MFTYAGFGGILRSELALPDLPAAADDARPDWTLRIAGPIPPPDHPPLGADVVFGECMVRGWRTDSGYALVFDDTGRFDISANGADITWRRAVDGVDDLAAADVTSRVIAMALHAGGTFCLHASAVSIGDAGVAFLAPKYHGKSTLCSALVRAGARAVSDDTVPVRLGGTPLLSPGVPRLRLWGDAATRLFDVEREAGRKYVIESMPDESVETRSVPFRAAYVLSPVTDLPDGAAAAREPLESVGATLAVLMHAKLGPVLGGAEAPALLAHAAAVATSVPVYALHVVRDLDRLDEVAAVVSGWHAADAAAATA